MIKKHLWYFVSLLFLGAAIVFFLFVPFGKTFTGDPRSVIPLNTILFIESHDFKAVARVLREESKIWNAMLQVPGFMRTEEQLALLDTLSARNRTAREISESRNLVLSFHMMGNGEMEYLFLAEVQKRGGKKDLVDFLRANYPRGKITQRSYSGNEMVHLTLEQNNLKTDVHFCFTQGLFMLSSAELLLEKAIRQTEVRDQLSSDRDLGRLAATAGKNVGANIFLNYRNTADFLQRLVKPGHREALSEFSRMALWSSLDVTLKENAVLMNGYTAISDSSTDILGLFRDQESCLSTVEEVLPSSTSAFISLAVSNLRGYQETLQKVRQESGKGKKHAAALEASNRKAGCDLREVFFPLLDREVCMVYTQVPGTESGEVFFVMKTKSNSLATEGLKEMTGKAASVSGIRESEYVSRGSIDRDTRFDIYRMPVPDIPGLLFGGFFGGNDFSYAAFFGNYLVMGRSGAALQSFLHDNYLKKTLSNEPGYREVSTCLSTRHNLYFYADPVRAGWLVKKYMNGKFSAAFLANMETYRKIQGAGFQISSDNGMLFNNLFVKYSPVYTEEARTEWESLLDTAARTKPQFVTNHNTGEKDILVQDMKNQVYLINSSGRVLWKLRIGEAIMSEIYQIDFYGNNKLQLLFSTRNRIYLIDRNGNNVERYPLVLRSPATNGLALFDYDNDRNYRLLIACEDRKIYLYDKDGALLKDWRFPGTESQVHMAASHFRIDGKDYIVFADNLRIYILDRRGNTRVSLSKPFPVSANNRFILDEPRNLPARMITSDETGKIHFITFSGAIETVEIRNFSPAHFFDCRDLDGDGAREYIFVDGNRLEVYRRNKSLLFAYEFNHPVMLPPNIYQFSYNDLKIGIVIPEENRIFLFNNNGKLYRGFPLQGKTMFSIGRLNRSASRFNLIVGNRDNFLLNYSVE